MRGEPETNRRPPAVWLDLTTSLRLGASQANGTLRVELSYAEALGALLGPSLRYCQYLRNRRRFVALAGAPDFAGMKPAVARAKREKRGLGKFAAGLERNLRRWRRSAVGGARLWLDRLTGADPFGDAAPGDVLLLLGETWGQHDLALLRAMKRRKSIRIAALCQDLIPMKLPQFFESGAMVERVRAFGQFLAQDADLVIAISQATAADIADEARPLGGVKGRLATIRLGEDFDLSVKPDRPAALGELAADSFVLSVSTIQRRKNFELLYRLWRRFCEAALPDLPKLVIVGSKGFGSEVLLRQIAEDPVTRGSILLLHQASDAELAWLYRHCLFTLYPSFYEGWGLPVSESLAHGKLCLASDRSSLPEAGQGLARHLDPTDDDAWAEAIRELLAHPALIAAAQETIRAQFRPMTWRQSAEALAAPLQELLAQPLPAA